MPRPALVLVLDTSPAVALDVLGYVRTLLQIPDLQLVLPTTVAAELRAKAGAPGSTLPELVRPSAVPENAIRTLLHDSRTPRRLGLGELGVVAMTESMRDPSAEVVAVIDDGPACRFAVQRGLAVGAGLMGTLGVLGMLHGRGLQKRSAAGEIEILRAAKQRLGIALIDQFLDDRAAELAPARTAVMPTAQAWMRSVRKGGTHRTLRRPSSRGDRGPGRRLG